jgi:hypothetical protein
MKHWLLAAPLLAAPIVSFGAPITGPYDVVDVEYWGTLYNCAGDCSDLPDVLHGRLQIDLSLAPRDTRDEPLIGEYSRHATGFVAPGFVIAQGQFLRGLSADMVVVGDLNPSAAELYRVQNHSSITVDGLLVAEQRTEVGIASLRQWGIEGDSIVQQFDVRTADVDGEGDGIVSELLNGVSRGYSFLIDRMRVTPRVCRP